MVRIMLLIMLSWSHALRGDDIDPKAWWNQLAAQGDKDTPGVIRNLTISSSTTPKGRRWDKLMGDFSGLGFLQYVPADQVDFLRRLNPEQDVQALPHELRFDPQLLQIVLLDRGPRMSVLASNKHAYKTIAHWDISANDRQNSQAVLQWLTKNRGYDAIVLDSRDGLILAALLKNTSELGQGLLLKHSAQRWIVKESQTRGEALLQMLKVEGSLAVFDILLAKGKSLNVENGAKILLGQNDKWLKRLLPETDDPGPQPLGKPATKTDSSPSEP